MPWLLRHVFVHGQFPVVHIYTVWAADIDSWDLVDGVRPAEDRRRREALGAFQKPVLAMVMLLPFMLNAASFSRFGTELS